MNFFKGVIWGFLLTALAAVCLWLLIDILVILCWVYKTP